MLNNYCKYKVIKLKLYIVLYFRYKSNNIVKTVFDNIYIKHIHLEIN